MLIEIKITLFSLTRRNYLTAFLMKGVHGAEYLKIKNYIGREPWSSGYGKRLMFQRLWV